MKKSDIINDDKIENIRQKSFDHDEETKPKRSKLVKLLLNIFESIIDLFT
jgi:hypothetical protein